MPFFFLGSRRFKKRQSGRGQRVSHGREAIWRGQDVELGKEGKELLKIDSAAIGMESARKYQSTRTSAKQFSIIRRQADLGSGGALYAGAGGFAQLSDKGTEGEAAKKENGQTVNPDVKPVSEWQNRFGISPSQRRIRENPEDMLNNIRQLTIRYIFQMLFGGRRKAWSEDSAGEDYGVEDQTEGASESRTVSEELTGEQMLQRMFVTVTPRPATMQALMYSAEYYESEKEETAFSTVGHVKTADGREIDFNVNIGMSREFERRYNEEVQMTDFKLCDPLVINLDTEVAALEDQTFYFDIDADGTEDEISRLGAGSGYLALDENGDGKINDGSELFGTKSGNGFADLAKYDEDHNGWIDENDAVWQRLKIWTKDSAGNDVLYRLADKNVGAICLQNVSTDHTLKGDDGKTRGAIRNTGVFLYENGNVGTIQHVDVAKYAKLA